MPEDDISRYKGGYCSHKTCDGRVREVEVTEEHKEQSSHGNAGMELKNVLSCSGCSYTRYFYK